MLGRLFERRALSTPAWGHTNPSSPWGAWPGDASYGGASGDALQLLTVLGCVRLISDSISTLPLDVFRRSGGQSVEVSKPAWLIEPMVGLDFASWCGQVLSSLLLHGNAYVLIGRNAAGGIVELRVLDPSMVRVEGGRYFVNGREAFDLLHVKGLMLPGADVGLNPIAYARTTIGLGLSALSYGADYFKAGFGNMPGVIEIPKVAQPETKRETANHWLRMRRTPGLPGVLDDGATWKPTGVSNEDAQFLATRNFTAAEIAGQLFLVDPSDLGIGVEGTSLTYANLEQRNVRRVQVTLLPWITRLETALSALLAAPRFVKFNVEGLLRADMKSRYESYAIGIGNQFMTPNEAREYEDMPPLPGGEVVVSKAAAVPAPSEDTKDDPAERWTINNYLPAAATPVVNVQAPPPAEVRVPVEVKTAAPVVNVAAPNVELGGVQVHPTIEAAGRAATVRHLERDERGQIVRIREEEV